MRRKLLQVPIFRPTYNHSCMSPFPSSLFLNTEEVPSCQRPASTCALDLILPCFCKDLLPSLFCMSNSSSSNAPGWFVLKILLQLHTPFEQSLGLKGDHCLSLLACPHSLCPHLISPLPLAGTTSPLKLLFLRSSASSMLANPMVAFLPLAVSLLLSIQIASL